jgi:hypothetical protein
VGVVSLGQKKASKKLVKESKVNGKHRFTVAGSKKCAKVMTQRSVLGFIVQTVLYGKRTDRGQTAS